MHACIAPTKGHPELSRRGNARRSSTLRPPPPAEGCRAGCSTPCPPAQDAEYEGPYHFPELRRQGDRRLLTSCLENRCQDGRLSALQSRRRKHEMNNWTASSEISSAEASVTKCGSARPGWKEERPSSRSLNGWNGRLLFSPYSSIASWRQVG
eukprot:scaffold223440_cov37-Tisochrysis_lutea.AAC.2